MRTIDDFDIGCPASQIAPGRIGHLVSKQPHTRTDGTPSAILTWRVQCTHPGCTTTFEDTTGPNGGNIRKHCDDHRLTPAEYMALGREKRRENVKAQKAAKRLAKAAERERKAAEKEAAKAARQSALAGLREVRANPLGHPRRKLSDADVAEIRKLHAEGLTWQDLTLVFPVAGSTIRNILSGARRVG